MAESPVWRDPARRYKGNNFDPNYRYRNGPARPPPPAQTSYAHGPRPRQFQRNDRVYEQHHDDRRGRGYDYRPPEARGDADYRVPQLDGYKGNPRGYHREQLPFERPYSPPHAQANDQGSARPPSLTPAHNHRPPSRQEQQPAQSTEGPSLPSASPSLVSAVSSVASAPTVVPTPPLPDIAPAATGAGLDSLAKLRQFKSEVQASRQSRVAPELDSSQLAAMAESFLASQIAQISPAPAPAGTGMTTAREDVSPRKREAILKEKLQARQKQESDPGLAMKRERLEEGEIVPTAPLEPKRARPDDGVVAVEPPRAQAPLPGQANGRTGNHAPGPQSYVVQTRGYDTLEQRQELPPEEKHPRRSLETDDHYGRGNGREDYTRHRSPQGRREPGRAEYDYRRESRISDYSCVERRS
jgi:hypothetical protein